jgi:hypothetical protein
VRATRATRLLTLEREQFIAAVTGLPRSRQLTEDVIEEHLAGGVRKDGGAVRSAPG